MDPQAPDPAATIRDIGLPIYQSKGWLKLLGVLSIIQGIMVAFSIIGIIIAWLPIWIGVVLYQSATTMETAYASGNAHMMRLALDKLKLYFTIQGILTLIGLIVGAMALMMGFMGMVFDAIS